MSSIVGDAAWECPACHRVQLVPVPEVSYVRIAAELCKCQCPRAVTQPLAINALARSCDEFNRLMEDRFDRIAIMRKAMAEVNW